jgi:hypothetical protein
MLQYMWETLMHKEMDFMYIKTKNKTNTFLCNWRTLSPLLDPPEGQTMLSSGKLGLEGRSRLPTLKGGRGAC